MKNPTPNFAKIKATVPVDTALAHYGISLTPHGGRLYAPCPLHNGTNPKAFVLSEDRHAWCCFGDCDRGGSVLDVVAALEDLSLVEAARLISKRHGLSS